MCYGSVVEQLPSVHEVGPVQLAKRDTDRERRGRRRRREERKEERGWGRREKKK